MNPKFAHSIMIAMTAAICFACQQSGDEPFPVPVPVPEPEATAMAISFCGLEDSGEDVNMVKGQGRALLTRSATPLSDVVSSFTVWGYKNMAYDNDASTMQTVFPGYAVEWQANSAATTSTNSSNWEYLGYTSPVTSATQTVKYWDFSALAYRFYAVTGYFSHNPHAPNGPHEFSIAADATTAENINATAYFSHLWFSTGQLPTYADKQFGKPVTLEFLKPFSKVRLMFNYSYDEEGIRLEDICFKPEADYEAAEAAKVKIPLKGTFTVSYPLTGTETRESFTITDIDAPSRLDAFTEEYIPEGTEKWYTVLPNNTQGCYKLSVLVNGVDRTATVPENFMQWYPGYSYTYIFKVTEEGGVEIESVQSAVMQWTELENEHTVYNW